MRNPSHILITGASSGIGAALACLYAAHGIRLSLHGRDEGRLNSVADKARALGAAVTTHLGDVRDAASMASWIAACDAAQPLDLGIANAGIAAGTGGGVESAAQANAVFTTNLTGVLNTVHPALPLMLARGRGQIALMSSLAGFRGLPGAPAYCASKGAIRLYGEALRGDLLPLGVEVNVICPGYVTTPMTQDNPYPMPFLMCEERAARIIRDGLARNRARIAFPWPMHVLVRLLALLPLDWADRRMAKTPRKPAMDRLQ